MFDPAVRPTNMPFVATASEKSLLDALPAVQDAIPRPTSAPERPMSASRERNTTPYAQLFAFCFVTSENGAASAVEREDSKRTPACVPNAAAANVGAPAPEGCVAVAEPVDAAHDVTGEPSASVAASESAVQRSVGAGTSYTTSGTGATISPSRLPGRSTKLLTALELSTYLASSSHVSEPCSPTVSTRSG